MAERLDPMQECTWVVLRRLLMTWGNIIKADWQVFAFLASQLGAPVRRGSHQELQFKVISKLFAVKFSTLLLIVCQRSSTQHTTVYLLTKDDPPFSPGDSPPASSFPKPSLLAFLLITLNHCPLTASNASSSQPPPLPSSSP